MFMKNKASIWLKLESIASIGSKYGASLFLYRPRFLLYKMNWEFHKTDKDDIICIPHGDSIGGDKKYQLNPYTGVVYHKKKEIGKLHKKEYKRLWADEKFFDFVEEARKVYLERKPHAVLPDMPILVSERKRITKCKKTSVQEYKNILYVEIPNN